MSTSASSSVGEPLRGGAGEQVWVQLRFSGFRPGESPRRQITEPPEPHSVVMLANEVGDSRVGRRQCPLFRKKYNAEVLGAGLLAKAGAVNDHDVLLAD